MDVHCTACGEPWDTYHLRHDAIFETGLTHDQAKAWSNLPQKQRLSDHFRKEFATAGYVPDFTCVGPCNWRRGKRLLPSFETRKIAEAIEALTPDQIDELTFGVVKLDSFDLVRLRNRAENKMFPQKSSILGRLFFVDVAPCFNNEHFRGRIDKARKDGTLDITFTFVSDSPDSELTVRAQSAEDGGTRIFIRRA